MMGVISSADTKTPVKPVENVPFSRCTLGGGQVGRWAAARTRQRSFEGVVLGDQHFVHSQHLAELCHDLSGTSHDVLLASFLFLWGEAGVERIGGFHTLPVGNPAL